MVPFNELHINSLLFLQLVLQSLLFLFRAISLLYQTDQFVCHKRSYQVALGHQQAHDEELLHHAITCMIYGIF